MAGGLTVRAHATVRAERHDGRTRYTELRSAPPLTLRPTRGALHLVGGAAGPIGGDDLRLDLAVGPGATMTVRTAAAAVILPGPSGVASSGSVVARVGAGGILSWLPEPTILVRDCDHRATTSIDLEEDATLVWREEVVLGRHGEPSGSMLHRLKVDCGGRPLLRTDLGVGPRWPGSEGPSGIGDARAVGSVLVVGALASRLRASPVSGVRIALFPLDDDAVLATGLGERAGPLRDALDRALAPLIE